MNIDVDRLRKDLADDSYAGAFSGMPAMMMEAWEIENASDDEVIRQAIERGIDISVYQN